MKPIVAFVAITYLLSIALSLLVGLTGGNESPYVGLGFVAMLFPATAALVLRLALNEGPRVDWHRLPAAWIPVALLLIPLVMHAAMVPVTIALEGSLHWSAWLTPDADGLYHSPDERGWGVLTTNGLLLRIALNMVVGILVVSALALFEEIGWRAWLLPQLAERVGPRGAVVLVAVIASVWHTPYALSGIHHIDGVSAIDLALGEPIGHIGPGLVIGWLWLRTRSIWIAALAHGALNNWGQYAFKYMDGPLAENSGAVLGAGVIGLVVVGGLLLWLAAGAARERPARTEQTRSAG